MQKQLLPIVSASCLLWFHVTPARGALSVSNIGQTPTGNAAIGSDYWVAQIFNISASDPNQYMLDSIQLLLNPAIGNPSGFEVSVYSSALSAPPLQEYLGTLVGSIDPSTGGVYDYTASGITLSGVGRHFVVLTSSTPIAQGAYVWSAVSEDVTTSGSWRIDNGYYSSLDGSNWEVHDREEVFQLAIYATLVPEPATLVLVGLGVGVLSLLHRCAGHWLRCGREGMRALPR